MSRRLPTSGRARCRNADSPDDRSPGHGSGPRPLGDLLAQVAEERGLDFEPMPDAVTAVLPGLLQTVEDLVARFGDLQERRWFAAALAALSHHVQASTLTDPPEQGHAARLWYRPQTRAGVALAVVTSPRGVLAGRRRDGIPRWVFPGGAIEDGETPSQAAVRECAEETGLLVVAEQVIGRRIHPVTDQLIAYVACVPAAGDEVRVAAPGELVEVCWLGRDQIEDLMPDLHGPVRHHLDQYDTGRTER